MAVNPQQSFLECSKPSVALVHSSPAETDGKFRIQVLDRFGNFDANGTMQAAIAHQQAYHPVTGLLMGVMALGLFNLRVGTSAGAIKLGQTTGIYLNNSTTGGDAMGDF